MNRSKPKLGASVYRNVTGGWAQTTPSLRSFLRTNKIIKRLSDCFPVFQRLFELGWRLLRRRRQQTWQCEQQQSGGTLHHSTNSQFKARGWRKFFRTIGRITDTRRGEKGRSGALLCLKGAATKWRWMGSVGRSHQSVRYTVSTC